LSNNSIATTQHCHKYDDDLEMLTHLPVDIESGAIDRLTMKIGGSGTECVVHVLGRLRLI